MSIALCGASSDELQGDGDILNSSLNTADIDHCDQLSEHIGDLALKPDYHDVTFVVQNRNFPAHRVILASRCSYFRALLYGGMREATPEATIPIHDANADAFEALLKYVYTGRMKLGVMTEASIIDILGLAHKYGFPSLEEAVSDHLRNSLTVCNACVIYDVALLYSRSKLVNATAEFINRNCTDILDSNAFLNLSLDAVKSIVDQDSFCVQEKVIFRSVQAWCKVNMSYDELSEDKLKQRDELLQTIRLPLMSLSDLLNVVRPTGLVSPDALLDAVQIQSERNGGELAHRGVLRLDENVATEEHGAQVILGDMGSELLNDDTVYYDVDYGFTKHDILAEKPCKEKGIKIKLGQQSIINRIQMLLWDRDNRSFSYYVEVSVNDVNWIRVVDYSKYLCRSWQDLHFAKQVVRYIRVVGTHSTANKQFWVVGLEAMYSTQTAAMKNGLILPNFNVATTDNSACIVEGVSRDRNALINGDTQMYDWDSGYTCHQLRNGAIVVQLAQPFLIGTIKLLLWDIDNRSYSYYIEVTTDGEQWTEVADKRKEECKSWQVLQFDLVPASMIRLVGTRNTANEVFHCVHFECFGTCPVMATPFSEKFANRLIRRRFADDPPPAVHVEADAGADNNGPEHQQAGEAAGDAGAGLFNADE